MRAAWLPATVEMRSGKREQQLTLLMNDNHRPLQAVNIIF